MRASGVARTVNIATRVMLVVLAVGCARGAPATTTPRGAADLSSGVTKTVELWQQANEVRSFEALEKVYAPDGNVAVVQNGVLQLGWTAVAPVIKDRLARAKEIHIRMKDVKVMPVGRDAAIVVATMTRELTDGAATVTETGALTMMLRSIEQGTGCSGPCPLSWFIVAEHFSYKLQP
ncbi:MAG: nuclear transport factor 2 family protein [Kofleriaceae bacterium]